MRTAAVLVGWLALAARPTEIDACSCLRPSVYSFPQGPGAPVNTHVFLWVPPKYSRGARTNAPRTFTLHEAGPTGQHPVVAVERVEVGSGALGVVELIPRRPLKPRMQYAVVEDETAQRVGSFTTSDAIDMTPPAWRGVYNAEHLVDDVVCCACQTGAPYTIGTLVSRVTDDSYGEAQSLLAVWLADASGKIDYAQPPTTYTHASVRFSLGDPSSCSPANFTYPSATTMLIGIKAVDVAGNATWESEVRVPIAKPRVRNR